MAYMLYMVASSPAFALSVEQEATHEFLPQKACDLQNKALCKTKKQI